MRCSASAPGKIILFGEHFVVYNKPAIVTAIGLRARVDAEKIEEREVKLRRGRRDNPAVRAAEYLIERIGGENGVLLDISSEIPPSVGLGSSASISVASAAATALLLTGELNLELILEAAVEGERRVHYNPSGIDTAIATYGGGGVYRRSRGFRKLEIGLEKILVIDTGRERRTGEMVRRVKFFADKNPDRFEALLQEAENLVEEAEDALIEGDVKKTGLLMNRNQELLREVGVSSPEIEEAVSLSLKAGAYGAKLTGGGGGGCVIAVAEEDSLGLVASKISERFRVFVPELMVEGVRVESEDV